ncbi:MAG: hypothetical protein LLG00_01055 [Planctomycetaceae bacterium]|nr:hypothetical protein [Planctomycetaceae bacterium]
MCRSCFTKIVRRLGSVRVCLAALVMAIALDSTALAQGLLRAIRDDVRSESAAAPACEPARDDSRNNDPEPCNCNGGANEGWTAESPRPADAESSLPSPLGVAIFAAGTVTAPIWAPHALMADDFANSGYFRRSPYDDADGYIATSQFAVGTKPVAARLDVEYANAFDRLESVNSHLLVETAPRLGLTASINHLEERLCGGGRDQLQIGDCNVVYRFAQCEWAECRTGLGVNWLDDAQGADFGFNFSYALDLYPHKPWVLSAGIDAGTLGQASLFRFRSTAGLVFHGVETYAGYEYTDIGRTHWHNAIAGVRLWF